MNSRNIEKTIGLVFVILVALVAGVNIIQGIAFFSDAPYDILYHIMTFIISIAITTMIIKGTLKSWQVMLPIPITMITIFLILVVTCKWEGTAEGLFLTSPNWLGGFSQGGYIGCFDPPFVSRELLSGAFNLGNFIVFRNSAYLNTLLYWPGLIVWVITLSLLIIITKPICKKA